VINELATNLYGKQVPSYNATMNQNTLHVQIRGAGDINSWRKKALSVIKAECLKNDVDWTTLQIVVKLPRHDVVFTKDPGHAILITRHLLSN
jgi:uncharacterized protein YjhX (UPF0386 family)